MKVRAFVSELRRRRVFTSAVLYAVVAWLLIQVAATTFPHLNVPDWAVPLLIVVAAFGFPLALIIAWGFDVTPDGLVRTEDAMAAPAVTRGASPAAPVFVTPAQDGHVPDRAPEPEQRSIAVLPFVNMSADSEQEYFSDGIAEEILNVLARIAELRVSARTSSFTFKGKSMPVDEIAERLRVAHVLEGSVRKSGNMVRITAQLIEARSGFHLWSDTYQRELCDVFAIQDEIAAAVAAALRIRLVGEPRPAGSRETASTEAHSLYLKGRFHLNAIRRGELYRALEYFQAAVEKDPHYALAHVGIGEAYSFLADSAISPLEALPRIREAYTRALELDGDLADAHALVGATEANWGWDWKAARSCLDKALRLNPSHAGAHLYSAMYWWAFGDLDRALEECRRAELLDPVSPFVSYLLATLLLFRGDTDGALAQHARTEELAPGFVYHDSFTGDAHRDKGQFEEAAACYAHAEAVLGRPSSGRATMLVRAGRREEAGAIAAELARRYDGGEYVPPELIARVHVALGEHDQAVEWLRRGIEARSALTIALPVWPDFAPLRADPRYTAIRREAGLPV